MNNDFTLLYCTCDKYMCLWEGYFTLLRKYWPSFNSEIILNTEEESYQYQGLNIHRPPQSLFGMTWSQRIKACLELVSTPFVLFTLDDFYLKSPVDNQRFLECVDFMKSKPEIGVITFASEPGPNMSIDELSGFEKRGFFSKYRINAQIGLWRKDYLERILRLNENPWQFELNGSFRSLFLPKTVLSQEKDSPTIFDYDYGFLMIRGGINPEIQSYFQEKEGVTISYSPAPTTSKTPTTPRLLRIIRYAVDMFSSVFHR